MRPAPLLAALASLVALTTASGCGGDSAPDASRPTPIATPSGPVTGFPTGEVTGRLLRSGGPSGTADKPVRGDLVFRGPDGSVTRTNVDSGGEFRIRLAPGRYRLQGRSPDVGGVLCATDPPVTELIADKTVTADIICAIK